MFLALIHIQDRALKAVVLQSAVFLYSTHANITYVWTEHHKLNFKCIVKIELMMFCRGRDVLVHGHICV